jgi:hypothetical protein
VAPEVRPSSACHLATEIIAYGRQTSGVTWLAYRHSTDAGVTWRTPGVLVQATSLAADTPVVAAGSDTFVAAFMRCRDAANSAGTGGEAATYSRRSTNGGATWTVPEVAAFAAGKISSPVGLARRPSAVTLMVAIFDRATHASALAVRRGS